MVICTPDKDLAQYVRGTSIVQLNRRTRVIIDEAGVVQKFGVSPESIPDYLALVGGCSRWLSWASGLGREMFGCRAGQLRLESIAKETLNKLVSSR